MSTNITVTQKGQTTIPVDFRRKLGLDTHGGTLQVRFDEQRGEMIVSRVVSLEEIRARTSKLIKPGTKPLTEVDAYYQAHRKVT